jgi:hypothetical protein
MKFNETFNPKRNASILVTNYLVFKLLVYNCKRLSSPFLNRLTLNQAKISFWLILLGIYLIKIVFNVIHLKLFPVSLYW